MRCKNCGKAADQHNAKTRASISCVRWLEQSIAACGPLGLVPMVYAREDRGEPIVIMRAADAMKLMRGEM